MKKELMIEGMMCQNCVKHVTHALEGISGASHVQVSLENKKATVEVPGVRYRRNPKSGSYRGGLQSHRDYPP